jgi:hypothetical protein
MADLIALNQFESDAERKVRERLLSNIAQLVSKFVHDVSIKSGLSEKVASEAGGRIYTSGSYRWVRALNDSTLDCNEFRFLRRLTDGVMVDWECTALDQISIRSASARDTSFENTSLASSDRC